MGPSVELIQAFFFYSAILVLKLLAMSLITGLRRFTNKVFGNPEIATPHKLKVTDDDDNVERVRRAHLNDLENIVPFLIIGCAYISTNPDLGCALMLFRIFAVARFAHTFVYAIYVVPQPARGASWFTGYLVTGYMAVKSAMYFM